MIMAELKRKKCCCGANEKNPCVCMKKGVMNCSKSEPKCPCYKALDLKKAFDGAWDLVKDIATATRSAELWAQNDEEIYFTVIEAIKSAVQSGVEREDVHTMLATQILPSAMISNPGFQQELVEYGEVDAMSDVDWAEVADGFIDYYDQYKEEMV